MDCEPSMKPISKFEFDFERRKLTKDDVRELIYREVWFLSMILFPELLEVIFHFIAEFILVPSTDLRVSPTNVEGVSSRCRPK